MQTGDGATTPPPPLPGMSGWPLALTVQGGAPPGSSLVVASSMGAAAVAGDLGSRLLQIHDQRVFPNLCRPATRHVAGDAVVGEESFAGHNMSRAVVADPPDNVGVGRAPGHTLHADEFVLAVIKKCNVFGRTESLVCSGIQGQRSTLLNRNCWLRSRWHAIPFERLKRHS